MSSTGAVAQIPVLISPVAAFAIFAIVAVRTGETFEAARLFSSLSLILLLAAPLFGTCETLLGMQSSLACFDRIQKFLLANSRVDPRILVPAQRVSQADTSRYEEGPLERGSSIALAGHLEFVNTPKFTQSTEQDLRNDTDIHMHNSSFAWSIDAQFAVNKVNLTVMKGQLLVLVGPVASGKSTLLRGLLGEVPVTTGTVTMTRARMSWCDQTPWLKVSGHRIHGKQPTTDCEQQE
jgi:ATP-binding cassette subfamily C (CFTR/MRP) protein 1